MIWFDLIFFYYFFFFQSFQHQSTQLEDEKKNE